MRQLLKLRLSFMLAGLSLLLGLLMPATALAANPPQCSNGGGAYDCSAKSDSYPADGNGGQFQDGHCYKLQITQQFGPVYYDQGADGCKQLPFSAGVATGPGVNSNNGECKPGSSFFGLPTWYKYLPGDTITTGNGTICQPRIKSLNDVWLIVAAIIEILLRLVALVAIALIVWGGIQYITSQGEPDKTSKARSTITNALIGLVIAVAAVTLVSFIAGRFQ